MVGGTGWVGGPGAGGVVAVGWSVFGGEVVGSVLVVVVSVSVVFVVDPSSAGLVVVPMITDSTCGGSLTVVALAA